MNSAQLFHIAKEPRLIALSDVGISRFKWPQDYIFVANIDLEQIGYYFSTLMMSANENEPLGCVNFIKGCTRNANWTACKGVTPTSLHLRPIINGDVVVLSSGTTIRLLNYLATEELKINIIPTGYLLVYYDGVEQEYSNPYPVEKMSSYYTRGKKDITIEEYLQNFVDDVNSGTNVFKTASFTPIYK